MLAQCGSDIDAAIRRLNELRLGAEQAAAADAAQTGAGSTAGGLTAATCASIWLTGSGSPACSPHPACSNNRTHPSRCPCCTGTSTAAPAGEQQGQQQAQEQQQPQQQQQSAPPPEQPAGPQTADEWTDALVAEMAAARDLPDAKARAAKALTAFEQFVTTRVAGEQQRKAGNASGAGGRLEEVLRENAILKRAVQIQNARMQEAGARDAEVAALTATVAQYQERMRSLELSNYSLALHLSKATDGSALQPGHRPPDVF